MKLKKIKILAKGIGTGAGVASVCVGSAIGLVAGCYYGIVWLVTKYELSNPMIGVLIFGTIAFILITIAVSTGVIDEEKSKEKGKK